MIDSKLTNFKQTNIISIYIGIFLVFLSLIFLLLKSFINIDLLSFLPSSLKLIFYFSSGLLGLYLIRSEKSEIKIIDTINKNSNNNNLNGFLTLCILFLIILVTPFILSWFILDANFSGNTKDECTGEGACWTYVKVWLNRFVYGLYPNEEQWRINLSFISLAILGCAGFFCKRKI
jgi:general L-amino acid transport system permease protein